VELFLRGEMVDRQTHSIQVVPHYNPNLSESSDLLFITCGGVSKEDFHSYYSIFQLLRLKVNYWDAKLYRGISYDRSTSQRHEPSWVNLYKNKLLLVRLDSTIRALSDIAAHDLVSHFVQDETTLENSNVLVMAPSIDSGFKLPKYLVQTETEKVGQEHFVRKLTEEEFSDEFRFSSPDLTNIRKKCQAIEESESKKDPMYRYHVNVDKAECKQIGGSWFRMTWQYTYGSASLYRSPITMRHNFNGMELPNGQPAEIVPIIGYENNTIGLKNTDSYYFKLFFAIASSLPILKRLELLSYTDDERADELMIVKEIIAETIYKQLETEIQADHGQPFAKLKYIISLFDKEPKLMMNRPVIYGLLVILHRLETSTIWSTWTGMFKSFFVGQDRKLQQLVKIRQDLESKLEQSADKELDVRSIIDQAEAYAKRHKKGDKKVPDSVTQTSYLKHLFL
jgi:hypothetical protein